MSTEWSIVKKYLPELTKKSVGDQTLIPSLARDPEAMRRIRDAVSEISTTHRLIQADSREIGFLDDRSIHLVVTSPPYWNLKDYPENGSQLGAISDYEMFVQSLGEVWETVHRLLVPGGRLVIVVGDVLLSRRKYGRHVVFPLHASIQESCRRIGLDNLAPIIWYKIANAQLEAGGGRFLGKPYEPNAIIKHDVEYILMQRKPGGYRKPTEAMRILSVISSEEHQRWFQQIWRITGASTKDHPAPFPIGLAERLIRMFSFVGDVVLDPFVGSGSTAIAAARVGRSSVGIDVDADFIDLSARRFRKEIPPLISKADLTIEVLTDGE